MKAQQLNKDATQSNLEAALEALRLGHSLFPLYYPVNDGCSCGNPKCENVGKHPIPKHGQDEATTDERVVRAYERSVQAGLHALVHVRLVQLRV